MSKSKASTWGEFYHTLHIEAERIREMIKAAASQVSEATDTTAENTLTQKPEQEEHNTDAPTNQRLEGGNGNG